jgi:very-short-patch-repair endonuclease
LRGRVGCAVNAARKLRLEMTDAERKLWWRLRHRQIAGHKFRRQVPIGSFIVDFACMDARLIVEVDGEQHAEEQVLHDERRTRWLESVGYRVIRFWNREVLRETDSVCETILQALLAARAPTQPSPSRGEGS